MNMLVETFEPRRLFSVINCFVGLRTDLIHHGHMMPVTAIILADAPATIRYEVLVDGRAVGGVRHAKIVDGFTKLPDASVPAGKLGEHRVEVEIMGTVTAFSNSLPFQVIK